ncbi:MAG TPA: ABC transporter permease [Gammaproteobacteria bacterium]|nr:ABC transporter permease [Gammaproteobacteria bacterium]
MMQSLKIIMLNLRNLGSRKSVASGAVLGFAAVVAVLVAALSISAGFRAAFGATGADDVAVVLSGKADTEATSTLSADDIHAIASLPGVAHTPNGPLAAPEMVGTLDVNYKQSGKDASIVFRGVTPNARRLRPAVTLVKGRWFKSGLNEIVVGTAATARFKNLAVGNSITYRGKQWQVVGIFSAGHSVFGSEAWTDVQVLQDAHKRPNLYSADFVKLTSPAAFAAFKQAATHDPRLDVTVKRARDYYAQQARGLSEFIAVAGAIIAGVMGIAAIFGALNTMYTMVSVRGREIATLRALGFGRLPVLLSVVVEALVLGLLGGVLGGVIAWLLFNGYQASTFNTSNAGQVAFAFAVTPAAIGTGIGFALILGLIGGFFPAIRAARLPVATALRET